MKRLSSSIALIGAFVALSITACDSDTGPEPGIKSITVTPAEVTMSVGDVVNLSASVETVGDASAETQWTSSNSGVATVDGNGVVTGVSAGTATITVTSTADPSKKASAAVTVTEPAPMQVSITGYRGVQDDDSDDQHLQSPERIGSLCCGAESDVVILEVDAEVNPGSKEIQSVALLLNGEVMSQQTVTRGAKIQARETTNWSFRWNTQSVGGAALDGNVIVPPTPNGTYTIGIRACPFEGQCKTVTAGDIEFANANQFYFTVLETPPNRVVDDFDPPFEWWGGPASGTYAITPVDFIGVGVGSMEVADVCGVFDIGAGAAGAPVTLTDPPFTIQTPVAANRLGAPVFCPFFDDVSNPQNDITTSDGESYTSRGVPFEANTQDPFLFVPPGEEGDLSSFPGFLGDFIPDFPDVFVPFLLLDHCAPLPTSTTDLFVRFPGVPPIAIVDQFFSGGVYQPDPNTMCGVENFITPPDNLIMDVQVTNTVTGEVTEDVVGPKALPEATNTTWEADVTRLEDPLGNVTDLDATPYPTSDDHGTDFNSPDRSNLLNGDGDPLRFMPDSRDFLATFTLSDPALADGNPGSGVDHPGTTIEFKDAAGNTVAGPIAPTDGVGAGGSEFDQDTNDDGTPGDYHVDVADLLGEGSFTAEFLVSPDLAALPNVDESSFDVDVDATRPSIKETDPPSRQVSSSQEELQFSVSGEVTDNFGLRSVLVDAKHPGPDGTCGTADDVDADEGSGPGEVDDQEQDVTANAGDFSVDFDVTNNDTDGVDGTGEDQVFCWVIRAADRAVEADGTPAPWIRLNATRTEIDWKPQN